MHGEVGAGEPTPQGSEPDAAETKSKGARTRQRLLELAVDRFGAQGYRATSVSEIARAAGLTQASAYTYFESKQALFIAALDADASGLVHEAGAQADLSPVTDAPLTFLVALFDGVQHHPLARRVLAGEEGDCKVFPDLIDLPAVRGATEILITKLREGQARGEVRADIDPVLVGAGIEGILLSILVATVQLGELGTQRRRDGVTAAFAAMLRPPT
jgi:AcrR family transcriptional regulator